MGSILLHVYMVSILLMPNLVTSALGSNTTTTSTTSDNLTYVTDNSTIADSSWSSGTPSANHTITINTESSSFTTIVTDVSATLNFTTTTETSTTEALEPTEIFIYWYWYASLAVGGLTLICISTLIIICVKKRRRCNKQDNAEIFVLKHDWTTKPTPTQTDTENNQTKIDSMYVNQENIMRSQTSTGKDQICQDTEIYQNTKQDESTYYDSQSNYVNQHIVANRNTRYNGSDIQIVINDIYQSVDDVKL